MTVKELIKELEKYPEDMKVYVWGGNWIREHQREITTLRERHDMVVESKKHPNSLDDGFHGLYIH